MQISWYSGDHVIAWSQHHGAITTTREHGHKIINKYYKQACKCFLVSEKDLLVNLEILDHRSVFAGSLNRDEVVWSAGLSETIYQLQRYKSSTCTSDRTTGGGMILLRTANPIASQHEVRWHDVGLFFPLKRKRKDWATKTTECLKIIMPIQTAMKVTNAVCFTLSSDFSGTYFNLSLSFIYSSQCMLSFQQWF